VLTVDYDKLGVAAGDVLLDLGAGGGRHAFEAARRGAKVVPVDLGAGDLKDAAAVLLGMVAEGAIDPSTYLGCVNGDATTLPFPDGAFDRVIASEVFEHIPDDAAAMREVTRVVRAGGTVAITIPRYGPERVCWAINDEYHAPFVAGGHVRIYRWSEIVALGRGAGLALRGWHHTHALHSPYWWLRCAVGPARPPDDHPLVRAYHRLLVWDLMERPAATRVAERVLNPVLGKSLVVYFEKPRPC
jgi:SAM-dependent methyltransferase